MTGAPLLGDVGNAQIASIFDPPAARYAPAFAVPGEVNYTFAGTRTQVFFGNRLEDILRLDVPLGFRARQELPDESVLAVSVLLTPLELKYWSDPYVEGEDRVGTGLSFPGARLRWGRILKTGLELTATVRRYRLDAENSGDWLIAQGRLDPNQQPLLDPDGNIFRLQALYRIDVNGHRFEPAVHYVNDAHNGAAVANKGYTLLLTYIYPSSKVVLNANVLYGARTAVETHPVYGEVLDKDRWGVALTAAFPVKRYTSSTLSIIVIGEVFRENANIDFFDTSIRALMVGIVWRHNRP